MWLDMKQLDAVQKTDTAKATAGATEADVKQSYKNKQRQIRIVTSFRHSNN